MGEARRRKLAGTYPRETDKQPQKKSKHHVGIVGGGINTFATIMAILMGRDKRGKHR